MWALHVILCKDLGDYLRMNKVVRGLAAYD